MALVNALEKNSPDVFYPHGGESNHRFMRIRSIWPFPVKGIQQGGPGIELQGDGLPVYRERNFGHYGRQRVGGGGGLSAGPARQAGHRRPRGSGDEKFSPGKVSRGAFHVSRVIHMIFWLMLSCGSQGRDAAKVWRRFCRKVHGAALEFTELRRNPHKVFRSVHVQPCGGQVQPGHFRFTGNQGFCSLPAFHPQQVVEFSLTALRGGK